MLAIARRDVTPTSGHLVSTNLWPPGSARWNANWLSTNCYRSSSSSATDYRAFECESVSIGAFLRGLDLAGNAGHSVMPYWALFQGCSTLHRLPDTAESVSSCWRLIESPALLSMGQRWEAGATLDASFRERIDRFWRTSDGNAVRERCLESKWGARRQQSVLRSPSFTISDGGFG